MRGLSAEHGNVAIIVALMMTTLLGFGAIAVDVGALYVRKQQLQTGADAAALAVAKQCSEFVVAGDAANCNDGAAALTADDFLNSNLPVALDDYDVDLTKSHGARAGRITVAASVEEPRLLSWAIDDDTDPITVGADATARWGPMTAIDGAFPLAVCKGALPAIDEDLEVTLWSAPSGDELTGECDGAPNALPLGWLDPSDPGECATKVTLIPSMSLDLSPSDTPPATGACNTAISDLLTEVATGGTATRVLAVYDASRVFTPSYSLIAFEFTGARLGGLNEDGGVAWAGVCGDGTYPVDDLQCIRGKVVNYDPPIDGPIFDPSVLGPLGNILDTTVLDVRLVD